MRFFRAIADFFRWTAKHPPGAPKSAYTCEVCRENSWERESTRCVVGTERERELKDLLDRERVSGGVIESEGVVMDERERDHSQCVDSGDPGPCDCHCHRAQTELLEALERARKSTPK